MAKKALKFESMKDSKADPVVGHIMAKGDVHVLELPKTVTEHVSDFLLAAAAAAKGVKKIRLANCTQNIHEMPVLGWAVPTNWKVTVSDPREAL